MTSPISSVVPRWTTKSVLIVDSLLRSNDLGAGLAKRGFEVFNAISWETAEWALWNKPEHALVELEFDGGAARDVLRFIRKHGLLTRVIVTTSRASPGVVWHSLSEGAVEVLPRPLSLLRVLQVLGVECESSAVGGEAMTLEQAKMQYINDVLLNSSSMAAASAVLGVDRRSLRRMLQRQAPGRDGGSAVEAWCSRRNGSR